MSIVSVVIAVVVLALILFFVKKSGCGGCCGPKHKDHPGEKK